MYRLRLCTLSQETLPLCAVLLPRPAQSSPVFPMSTLSLRGHEAQGSSWNLTLLPQSRREHVSRQ